MSRPDPLALAVGVLCLGAAVPAIADADDDALRWFLVWAAVLAGIVVAAGAVWTYVRKD